MAKNRESHPSIHACLFQFAPLVLWPLYKESNHSSSSYCVAPDGSDVEVLGMPPAADGSSEEATPSGIVESVTQGEGQHCHFYAGVE